MAKIYFKHLTFKNFMSYEYAELDLNREGNILVGGTNNNPEDSAKSNGCGKSTIFSALSWALTGETISGAKDVSNIYTEGKTEVTLTFDIDENSYEIRRTKNPSNLFFFINGEDRSGKGVRDTSQLIADYLPQVTPSLLNSVIILGQGLPQKFTNNSPAGRKEVLEKLSSSDFMIADLKGKLSKRKTELNKKKRDCEDFKLQYETTKQTLESQIKKHEQDLLFIEDEETLKRALEGRQQEIKECETEKEEAEQELEKLEDSLKTNRDNKDSLLKKNREEYEKLPLKSTEDRQQRLISLKSSFNSLDSKIREYESITDVCPTCGQKLPDVHKIDTTEMIHQRDEFAREIENVEQDIRDIKEENDKLISDFADEYDEKIRESEKAVKDLEEKVRMQKYNVENIIDRLNSRKTGEGELILKINTLADRKKAIEDEIDYKKKLIAEHEKQLYNNNEELETINNRLAINSKMLTYIQRDFRGHLLNNVITFIEDKSKEYSHSVFGTDKLSFTLEKNNIIIAYDGKDYSCLSGGEKQKLDIIIQFAIRDMLCTFLDFSSNILVLDEITDALDSIGVSKIFNLIGENLSDVEATYIISHHVDELEIPADDEIIVIKGDDKISRII